MKRTIYYLILLLFSGIAGCAPPVYRLTPETGEVAYVEGRPTTKVEQNGLKIVASYERLDLNFVALDVELKNLSDTPLEVNPANFRYAALQANQLDTLETLTNPVRKQLFSAADPMAEADKVIARQNQEVKRLKTARIINTVLMVAVVASDIASSTSSRNRREPARWVQNRVTHENLYTALQAKRMIDHGMFADRMQRYDYEAYRWNELALKRTTLQPGESARGQVFLPLSRDASYLLLSYPVSEAQPVNIRFRQEWVKRERPKRTRNR